MPDTSRASHFGRMQPIWLFAWSFVAAAAISPTPALAAEGVGGSLVVTSDYVSRGATRSKGRFSVLGDVHYYSADGWFVGLSAAKVKLASDQLTTAELDGYVGYSRNFGDDWSGRVGVLHYAYPWDQSAGQYDYDEVSGTLAFRDCLSLSFTASPNTEVLARGGTEAKLAAFAYDLAYHQPLGHALSVNAGVGYYDLRQSTGRGYAYWNLGLGYQLGRFQLNLAYIGSDHTAKSLFGGDAGQRVLGSLIWQF